MTNPFVVPGGVLGGHGPLRPWEIAEQDDYYAPVDNTQCSFEEFKTALGGGASLAAKGRTVLVSGGGGCGKTSLMHRCAHWLKQSGGPKATIFDLTEDGLDGADTPSRIRHVCGRLVDELELDGSLDEVPLTGLQERRDDPSKAFPYLSKIFQKSQRAAVVLLPPSEVFEEVARYAELARKNILLLAETSYPTVADTCRARLGPGTASQVLVLEVGMLHPGDGWRLVADRYARAGAELPEISEDTMLTFMEKRIAGTRGTTIHELQMVLQEVFEEAAGKERLDYADFADYYLRKARLL
ncbi:hypothetical protein EDD29_6594 [Actinocorallia herbida]|uniref:Uncharacterized protein n=1 Tax=Actinocorallia herbida TaxID=58109 RepID=A0A3N1D623_9ACTN|nr:hypothetical protein [Actinocorallia herbida]ROO88909.1 hypothetical protein EDD29_6594 [Actinocorallia herbida]